MSALSLVNNQSKEENGKSNNASDQSMTEILQRGKNASNSGNGNEDVLTNPEQITVAGVARRARIVPRQESVVKQDTTDAFDDDDDDKKRRRRSSLLRRSLSSSSLTIPILQSGKQLASPSPELLQAAALEDKKKKTRNYSIIKSELAYLNFEEGDDEDDDDDDMLFKSGTENEVRKPTESDEKSSKDENTMEPKGLLPKDDSKEVEESLDDLKSKSNAKWSATSNDKGSSEDGDSDTTSTSASTLSSRRSFFKRSGSYTNRGSVSIHHVVNPLDVTVKIVQSEGSGPNVYELLPNHTGNNRVGVMVDLQSDAFLSQVEQERKQQAFIQQNDSLNIVDRGPKRITNRVCQEVVRTVQEYWQGHFFVQVEEDNEIGYKQLSQKEALQAVYDIFQRTCYPAASIDDDIYECLANELPPATREVTTPFVNSSISSLTTTSSAPASRSQSDMSVSIATTLGHDDGMSITSQNTRSTDHNSVNPVLKAANPVLPENEDVHKSALASLQRRKQRQYATTKISNLVTGRGLIQQQPMKPSNKPRSLSDLGADTSAKIIPRHDSAPIAAATSDGSFSSFSSLPTTFAEARSRSNAKFSVPEGELVDLIESEQVVPSVIGRRRSEVPMMMQAAVRRSLVKSQLIGIDEDGDGDAYSVGVNTSLQERLSNKVAADAAFCRSSNSALDVDVCLLKTLEANDGVDLEPYHSVQQQPEMTAAALQQFQELFSSTPVNTLQPTNVTGEAVAAALLLQNENMLLQQQLQQQQMREQQGQQLLHGRQSFTGQYQMYGNATSDTNMYQNNVGVYSTNNQIVVPAAASVRFDPVHNANQSSGRRRSSIMGRRSSRLSEFSQAMIQEFLSQLNEDDALNEDEYY